MNRRHLPPPAPPDAVPFDDDFTALDLARWELPAHVLGRSTVRPSNTRVGDGTLRLSTPADTLDGAEISTRDPLPCGTYRAWMQVADAPGSLTGFFLYAEPDCAHEVDIEVFNESSGNALFTTFHDGRQTNHVEVYLGIDPTAGIHEYAFTTTRDGQVSFAVDGIHRQAWASGVPTVPMHLHVNLWYPTWRAGGPPDSDRTTVVDRIRYQPGPPATQPSS